LHSLCSRTDNFTGVRGKLETMKPGQHDDSICGPLWPPLKEEEWSRCLVVRRQSVPEDITPPGVSPQGKCLLTWYFQNWDIGEGVLSEREPIADLAANKMRSSGSLEGIFPCSLVGASGF
jgi:hypothetical protein